MILISLQKVHFERSLDDYIAAENRVQQAKEQQDKAKEAVKNAKTDEEKAAAENNYYKAVHALTVAYDNLNDSRKANRDAIRNVTLDAMHKKLKVGKYAPKPNKVAVAANRFKAMMHQFEYSITDVFRWLINQLGKIPGLARNIIDRLKGLWKRIKEWGSKYRIFYRAKALSRATVACVGFIASMVASWIYSIIFRKDNTRADQARSNANRLHRRASKYMDLFAHPKTTKKTSNETVGETETAVFIEAFGEILREDSNGGVFIATAKKFITNTCNSGKIDAICKVAKNSSNIAFEKLSKILNICIKGPNAILTNNANLATM